MENWSILSDSVRYVQHDERSKTPYRLDINTLDYHQHERLYCRLKEEESHTLNVVFHTNPETVRSNYLNMYEGVHAEVVCTNRVGENSDLSTTYLGQTEMTRETKIKVEKRFLFQDKVTLWENY